jgi:hypothetical protein
MTTLVLTIVLSYPIDLYKHSAVAESAANTPRLPPLDSPVEEILNRWRDNLGNSIS